MKPVHVSVLSIVFIIKTYTVKCQCSNKKYVIEINDFVAKRNSLNTDVEYRTKLNLLSFILNQI